MNTHEYRATQQPKTSYAQQTCVDIHTEKLAPFFNYKLRKRQRKRRDGQNNRSLCLCAQQHLQVTNVSLSQVSQHTLTARS